MADFGEKLLKRFATQGDERAFRDFVKLYVGMVQQVALRQTGSLRRLGCVRKGLES